MNIDLYFNSVCCGTATIEKVEEYCEEYRLAALSKAEELDWSEVILYAILAYDSKTGGVASADFMLLRMPYSRYAELCGRLSGYCRLFFTGRK